MWRDVGKGDLHEALQGQEGQTGSNDQLQELTCFILVEIERPGGNKSEQTNFKGMTLIN